jgi:uncharacterized cupin superfamily protein/GNAT superfamily N-acetyltransferase
MTSFIAHIDDLEEIEGTYPSPFDGEKLTIYRDLGRATGTKTMGFGYERLLPGRRSSFTHAHETEEEFVYVIAGECHVRLIEPGGAAREVGLRAGHAVAFQAGTGIAHTFVNHGTEECRLLIAGERRKTDRWFYAEDAEYEAHMVKNRAEKHWTRGDIRFAVESDTRTVLDFLERKAAFDRTMGVEGELAVSEDALRETLFNTTPYAWARLAEREGRVVGFALYYFRYSSFRGRPNLWLDDLYVLEDARSAGVGEAMMKDLVDIATRHKCSHLGWNASVQNTRGIAFYQRCGAEIAERMDKQVRFKLSL